MGLWKYGLVRAALADTWDIRSLDINSRLRKLIVNVRATHLVIEFPQFQGGIRGTAAARAGDTLKLAYLCGSISCGWQLWVANMMKESKNMMLLPLADLIHPSKWKGQLSKTITDKRCGERYGINSEGPLDNNFVDAIMLGDWYTEEKGWPHGVLVAERMDL
jgi:hypothetical protein